MPIRKSWCSPFLLTLRVLCTSFLLTIPFLTHGQVAMRMTSELDCQNGQLHVQLEAKSTSDSSLYIGNGTFRIGFNPEVLSFESYESLAFSSEVPCAEAGNGWFAHSVDSNSQLGEIAIILSMHPDSLSRACQQLDNESWTSWGSLTFDLILQGESPSLSFKRLDAQGVLVSSLNSAYPNDGSNALNLSFEEGMLPDSIRCEESLVYGALSLQGRSNQSVIASVALYSIDSLYTPAYTFAAETDEEGFFILDSISPGTYYLFAKYSNTLSRVQLINLDPGENYVEIPLLRGGDSNGDNEINLTDFSLLLQSYNKFREDPLYNSMVDFDNSQQVNILDFTILLSNYNQEGEAVGPSSAPQRLGQALSYPIKREADLRVETTRSQSAYWVGDTLSVDMWVDPNQLGVDGVEAHLSFDTDILELTDVTMGNEMELGLMVDTSTTKGRVSLAAGTFGTPHDQSFIFSRVTFIAKQEGDARLTLFDPKERASHITHKGFSILRQVSMPQLRVYDPQAENLLAVYPNPSQGQFMVEKPGIESVGQLRIYDLTGRVVHHFNWCSSCGSTYSFTLQQAGTFVIQFQSDDHIESAMLQVN